MSDQDADAEVDVGADAETGDATGGIQFGPGQDDTGDTGPDLEAADADGRPGPTDAPGGRAPYVESPIIMTTVRVVVPFVFTFGLFVMFHGANSPGGGFQGGVIVGTVVLLLGVAFGIATTRDWIGPRIPVAVVGLGVLTFVGIGAGSVLLGGGFLEYAVYGVKDATKYGIELVELAIGAVVAGVVTGLFFAVSAGGRPGGEPE